MVYFPLLMLDFPFPMLDFESFLSRGSNSLSFFRRRRVKLRSDLA